MAKLLDVSEDSVHLAFISFVLVNRVCKATNVERIYVPDVTLCDGMAYEYGEENKLISIKHNFEQDIIACAKNISKRYMGSRKRSETLEQIASHLRIAHKQSQSRQRSRADGKALAHGSGGVAHAVQGIGDLTHFLGHPLFCDARYGGDEILRGTTSGSYKSFVRNCFALCPRQALHFPSVRPILFAPRLLSLGKIF